MYDLTRKGRPFMWPNMDQEGFKEIKNGLLKAHVLHLPDNRGSYQLFSDAIKTAVG